MNVSGKKITVMGLGLLGRGVAVCQYLLEHGAQLVITDLKSADQLAESITRLERFKENITYVLERHRLQDFVDTDLVVKGPGVSLDNKYITAAREAGVAIKMDASWTVAELPDGVVTIGVTGTKGKSSISHLIAHILDNAIENGWGLNHSKTGMVAKNTQQSRVFLGGNVRGQATLPFLDTLKSGDYLVLELDSWQLQGFHDEKISPNISVFSNLMPDHLNYYKGMPEYFYDKSAIYKYQTKNDYLVLSSSSYEAYRQYDIDNKPNAKTAIVKASILMKDWEYSQPGEHNRLNAAMAYQVAKFIDISDEIIKEALASFPGVPGRLELVHQDSNKVRYYNDTNATTPESAGLSIKAINEKYGKPVVICGGVSKGFPNCKALETALNHYAAAAVLLPGGIDESVRGGLKVPYKQVGSMQEAVLVGSKYVDQLASKALMMSPGGSSFGLFKNEYDRGDQFDSAVRSL